MFTWFPGLFWIAGFVKTSILSWTSVTQTSLGISFYIILYCCLFSMYFYISGWPVGDTRFFNLLPESLVFFDCVEIIYSSFIPVIRWFLTTLISFPSFPLLSVCLSLFSGTFDWFQSLAQVRQVVSHWTIHFWLFISLHKVSLLCNSSRFFNSLCSLYWP